MKNYVNLNSHWKLIENNVELSMFGFLYFLASSQKENKREAVRLNSFVDYCKDFRCAEHLLLFKYE